MEMDDFYDRVQEYFDFLIKDFNYSISEKKHLNLYQTVTFHGDKCDIIVYCEYSGTVGVIINAINRVKGFKAGMSREIELVSIINYLNPKEFIELKTIKGDNYGVLKRMAGLLLKYYHLITENDLEIVTEVNKKMQAEREEFQRDPEKFLRKIGINLK